MNRDGHLGAEEVVKLISDLGCGKIDISQAENLISMVDDDGDRKISYTGDHKYYHASIIHYSAFTLITITITVCNIIIIYDY